jgi:hypothetical protein
MSEMSGFYRWREAWRNQNIKLWGRRTETLESTFGLHLDSGDHAFSREESRKSMRSCGGPGRVRTVDLFHAMEARSQLRHRPNPSVVSTTVHHLPSVSTAGARNPSDRSCSVLAHGHRQLGRHAAAHRVHHFRETLDGSTRAFLGSPSMVLDLDAVDSVPHDSFGISTVGGGVSPCRNRDMVSV